MKTLKRQPLNKVYLLQHVREEGTENQDVKTIGIYSTRANARKAKQSLCRKPGFRRQKNGFYIDAYILDKTFWVDGFVW